MLMQQRNAWSWPHSHRATRGPAGTHQMRQVLPKSKPNMRLTGMTTSQGRRRQDREEFQAYKGSAATVTMPQMVMTTRMFTCENLRTCKGQGEGGASEEHSASVEA
jgi:hypothetical protein